MPLGYTDKEVCDSLFCPHCKSKNIKISEGKEFDYNIVVDCKDCGEITKFRDNGFNVSYHLCEQCGSTNFQMKHNGGMTPCDWQCVSCGNVIPHSYSGNLVKINGVKDQDGYFDEEELFERLGIEQGKKISQSTLDELLMYYDISENPYTDDGVVGYYLDYKEGHPNEGENVIELIKVNRGYFLDYVG